MLIPSNQSYVSLTKENFDYKEKVYFNEEPKAKVRYGMIYDTGKKKCIYKIWSSFMYQMFINDKMKFLIRIKGFNRDNVGRNYLTMGISKQWCNSILNTSLLFKMDKIEPVIKNKIEIGKFGLIQNKLHNYKMETSYTFPIKKFHFGLIKLKTCLFSEKNNIVNNIDLKGFLQSNLYYFDKFDIYHENIINYSSNSNNYTFKNVLHLIKLDSYNLLFGALVSKDYYGIDVVILISKVRLNMPLLVIPSKQKYSFSFSNFIINFCLSNLIFFCLSKVLSFTSSKLRSTNVKINEDISSIMSIQETLSKPASENEKHQMNKPELSKRMKIHYAFYGKLSSLLKLKGTISTSEQIQSLSNDFYLSNEIINVTNTITLLIQDDENGTPSLKLENYDNYIGFTNPMLSRTEIPYLLISYQIGNNRSIKLESSQTVLHINN